MTRIRYRENADLYGFFYSFELPPALAGAKYFDSYIGFSRNYSFG